MIDSVSEENKFRIYVIATPRILLTNQLMNSVVSHLTQNKIGARRIIVHSGLGNDLEDISGYNNWEEELKALVNTSETSVSTSSIKLVEELGIAKQLNAPVLICSTYHSLGTITSSVKKCGVKIDALLCNEAHNVVSNEFFSSAKELKQHANKILFFTATQRTTQRESLKRAGVVVENTANGLGMDNEDFYGPIAYTKSYRYMYDNTYIVRPRMHLVEVGADATQQTSAIIDSYKEHKKTVKGHATLLVCCSTTAQFLRILETEQFEAFIDEEKANGATFKVFDISSERGAQIDGKVTKKEQFVKDLNAHTGAAVVFHIRMLTEGIGVPSMTSVVALADMKDSRLMQAIGRTSRLHKDDREQFDSGKLSRHIETMDELTALKKPYSWVIVPIFTDDGQDRHARVSGIISAMREFDFRPAEDVFISAKNGNKIEQIDLTTKPDEKKHGTMSNALFDICHVVENEIFASLLAGASAAIAEGRIEKYAEIARNMVGKK